MRGRVIPRILALLLSSALMTVPALAEVYPELSRRALRPLNAGMEESPVQKELGERLQEGETAAQIIRGLKLISDVSRPSEEIVRDFLRQLEADDGRKTPEAVLNRLTAHREYVAGFRRGEVEGRPEERPLLEALLADSRQVVEQAGRQLGLTEEEALAQLGWETIKRLATALYWARVMLPIFQAGVN